MKFAFQKKVAFIGIFLVLLSFSAFHFVQYVSAGGGIGMGANTLTVGQTATLSGYFTGYSCQTDPSQHTLIYARFSAYYLDQPGAIDLSNATIQPYINDQPVPGQLYYRTTDYIAYVIAPNQVFFHTTDRAEIRVSGVPITNPGRVGFSVDFVQDNWDTSCGFDPTYQYPPNPPIFQPYAILTFVNAPTPTPTTIPTPTMSPDTGFVPPGPVETTLVRGQYNWHTFTITSVTANQFSFYGYPTDYGPGINFVTASGGIVPGTSTDIAMEAINTVPLGTYYGTGHLRSDIPNAENTFPITVHVVDALPTPTVTPTVMPTATPTVTPSPTPVVVTMSNVSASNVTKSSAGITWTTSPAATSQVLYGTSANNLNLSTTENTTLVINHAVTLSSLNKNTTYYYKVVSRPTAGGTQFYSSVFSFRTPSH